MKKTTIQSTIASAPVDLLAILVAAMPIVYRVTALLRELKPEIQAALRSITARNEAESDAITQIHNLLEANDRLAKRLDEIDSRQERHSKLQDEALAALLRRLCDDDDNRQPEHAGGSDGAGT